MNGIYNILKPPGMSSAQVVGRMKRLLGEKHVGHAGTLDPEAAGVLVVCAGRDTRLMDYLCHRKEYVTELQLGVTSDTLDAWGHALQRRPVTVGRADVEAVLAQFRGDIEQLPPMYSALKYQGKKLYELARAGIEVQRKRRTVTIYDLQLLRRVDDTRYLLRVGCSGGTYVRTLCDDIGAALGCGGCMRYLVRTQSNGFALEDALTLEEAAELSTAGTLAQHAYTAQQAVMHLPALQLPQEHFTALHNGTALEMPGPDEALRVYGDDGFWGIGRREAGLLRMKVRYGAMIV